MKKLTEMIVIRGTGPQQGYFMKVAYCKRCGAEYTIPVEDRAPKCSECKMRMREKWHQIDKPDYTEHKANYNRRDRSVKDAGKNPRKFF